MSKVIKFAREEEILDSCPNCDLVESYIGHIADSDSVEELRYLLIELVKEASDLGHIEALKADAISKLEIIDRLQDTHEKCDCGECDVDWI